MFASKADIITQLQKAILPLQGLKSALSNTEVDIGLGPVRHAFPNERFPLGAVHEFCCAGAEDEAATGGFIAGILAALMQRGEVSIWISQSGTLFPPALKLFNIEPDKIIFLQLQKEKDMLWAMEEALRCEGLAAVVAEIKEINFTESRRLQLAVEQSKVTGFILRRNSRNLTTTACISRWKITSLPSRAESDMPGIGFPRWNVELLKIRNGYPGSWQIEWVAGRFRHIAKLTPLLSEQQKKTG